jgi:hypothetical protein
VARSIKTCVKCSQMREIAGHGLCFKCYRAAERKVADVLWSRPDPSAKELLKDQRRTRKGLMKMLDAIEEISPGKLVPEATIEAWRLLLQPEISRIAQSLGPKTGMDVNSGEEDLSELITELAELRDANSEEENTFTERSGQVHRPIQGDQSPGTPSATVHQPADQSPAVMESAQESSERVNREHTSVSEQFTEPAGTSEEKGRGEPPAETSGT